MSHHQKVHSYCLCLRLLGPASVGPFSSATVLHWLVVHDPWNASVPDRPRYLPCQPPSLGHGSVWPVSMRTPPDSGRRWRTSSTTAGRQSSPAGWRLCMRLTTMPSIGFRIRRRKHSWNEWMQGKVFLAQEPELCLTLASARVLNNFLLQYAVYISIFTVYASPFMVKMTACVLSRFNIAYQRRVCNCIVWCVLMQNVMI